MKFEAFLGLPILLVFLGAFGYWLYCAVKNSLYGFKEKELPRKAADIFEAEKALSWTILLGIPLTVWGALFVAVAVPSSYAVQRTASEYSDLFYLTAWSLIPGAILGVFVNTLRLNSIAKTQIMAYLMKRVDELSKDNENLRKDHLKLVK